MAKLKAITPQDAAEHLEKVHQVFKLLKTKDVYQGDSGFSADKEAIIKVFNNTNGFDKADILVRLTLIDSMYSTQMNRRYYALDELAGAMAKLANGEEYKLKQMFLDFSKTPNDSLQHFEYTEKVKNDKGEITVNNKNLFSECYGIGKDGEDKGVAISLISKYAYFLTDFNFPIYDSIACEMFPLVTHYCGWEELKNTKLVSSKNGKIQGAETMVLFVNAINSLIEKLNYKGVNYDLLDRFLWFVGKIRRGNLSLVLTREAYETVMILYPPLKYQKTNKNGKTKTITEHFNIDRVDINKISFLEKDCILRLFFELAKFYGHK